METDRICPNCRKPLPPDVPLGLCPECLIKSGFPTGTGPSASGEVAGARFVPPSVGEIAQLFPQLEILRLIGKGGMGAVYKARQPALDRFVALKVLPPAVASDPGFAERFNREARALARLSHPNIVAVHDFGKAGPLHYLLMEFVDGTNLREVERAGTLTPEQALAIVPQICEALQFAHNEGVVHRDVKPENLLLDKKGRLKITDFGIAKMVGLGARDALLTGAKDVVGTPHYMAPEQIEKPQTVDHRADIYSLGVVFYEMLTGELPLGKFAPPSRKVQVDVRLDEVVLHTLEKEPARRYQQANQVKTDVETITGTPPAGGHVATPPAFSTRTDQTLSDKTILPAFLLAFFFGVFGPHRFYVGKTGTAFLQLGAWCSCILMIIACATTGATFQPTLGILLGVTIFGCIIWATVDWILIACRAFTDGQGRRIAHWLNPQTGETKTAPGSTGVPPASSAAHKSAAGLQNAGTPGAGPPSGGAAPPTYGSPPPAPLTPGSASPSNTGIIIAPAVGLLIAALWKLLSVFSGALFLFPFTNRFFSEMVGGHFLAGWGPIAITGMVVFKVIPALFILFGAFQMLQLRSYAWSIAAGILAIISCSLISLPIGIWALIVLGRQDVRDRFTEAARSRQSKTILWPWILGAVLIVPLLILILFAFYFTAGASQVTVKGIVTNAATGKAIVGARVDDNRYGADADKAPAQAWTDANGRYELRTSYEEHTIAASAPGYETKLSLLRTKPFGSEQNVRMNFKLQPLNPVPVRTTLTNLRSAPSANSNLSVLSQQTVSSSKVTTTQAPAVPSVPPAAPVPPVVPASPVPSAPPVAASVHTPSSPKTTGKVSAPPTHWTKILAPPSSSDPFQRDFNRTLPLTADGRLQLDNVNGRIEIAGWDRNIVSIEALKHGKTQESIEDVRIEIHASADEISVHTKEQSNESGFSGIWAWLMGKNKKPTVDYAIQVPRTACLKKISNVNGRVEINDVSGDITASTVNGAMKIQNAAGRVKLSTVNGSIKAELDSLGTGQTVSLNTVNGRVEVTLPVNANAKVSASTVNGGLSSDFPELIMKKEFPLGRSLKGTLGNGGATVTASSVNGRINFRRGANDPG